MAATYLAFDLGASSGRAMSGRLNRGRMVLAEVHRFRTPVIERDGGLFWDIEALWQEVRRGLEMALSRAPDLRSLSVDSWAVDYVPLDPAGHVLRPPHCYRDPRVQGRLAEALRLVSPEMLYARTGIQMIEINTLYQLLADLEEEPDVVERTAYRLLIADHMLYRLSGRPITERTMGSTTQLMNIETGEWDELLMERFGLAGGWAPIVRPGTKLGPLALQTGASAPEVIASCSHDTACAVAAVPADANTSWAYVSSGTWSLMGVERSEPVLTDAAREANFTNEGGLDGTFRFLKNLTGLWVLQECQRIWQEQGEPVDVEQLMAEAEAADAAGGTLDLNDPRFAFRSDMPETIRVYCVEHGITPPRDRGAAVRLILESLAAGYAHTLREIEHILGEKIEVLHIVGGGSRNSLLCQWTADACGCRVVAGPAEATALGNLLIQARVMGDLSQEESIREVVRRSSTLVAYEPAKDATTLIDTK